jgi:hypothetical protein
MGKARAIQIDTRRFDKAGDATTFFSTMLNRYKIGEEVSDADGLDLAALLNRHDERDEKVGVGIAHFKVDRAPEPYFGKCFWIVRIDQSQVDFSFPHCISPKPFD